MEMLVSDLSELSININQVRLNNSILNFPVSLLCAQTLRKIRGDSGDEGEAVCTEPLRGDRNPASTVLSAFLLKGRVREMPP